MSMSGYYRDANAICPFYMKGSADSIQCEGCECTAIKLLFTDEKGNAEKNKRDTYGKKYCESNYEECGYYKLTNSQYGG